MYGILRFVKFLTGKDLEGSQVCMWNMSHITALWSAMKPAGVGAPEIRIVLWEWWHAYSIRLLGVISQLIKPIAYSIGVI